MDFGFDYRATSTFVTDPAVSAAVLGEAYPKTYTNGNSVSVTAGWVGSPDAGPRNRDATVDARLAGVNQQGNNGTQLTFQVDLPATGTYTIDLGLGDAGSGQAYQFLQIKDNTTVKVTIDKSTGTSIAQWYDATGVLRTSSSDWVTNKATTNVTFASTTLNLVVGTSGSQTGSSTIAHFRFTTVAAAGGVVTPRLLSLLGVGT